MPALQSHGAAATVLEEPSSRKRPYHRLFHSEGRRESHSPSTSCLRSSATPRPSEPANTSSSPHPRPRFIGDGFDYRRPIMSTSTRQPAVQTRSPAFDVIDLTDDYDPPLIRPSGQRRSVERRTTSRRPPSRGGHPQASRQRGEGIQPIADPQPSTRPVIHLDSPHMDTSAPGLWTRSEESLLVRDEDLPALFQQPPSSPGFEITGERSVRAERATRSVAERRPTPYVTEEERDHSEAPPLPDRLFENLPHGLGSWLTHAMPRFAGRVRAPQTEHSETPQATRSNRLNYFDGLYGPSPALFNTGAGWMQQPQLQLPRIEALDFQQPRLNYEAQGFELVTAPRHSPPPRPTTPYKAPNAAAAGFSRRVAEEDIAVCPHCGDELRTGDGDLKQQIWVIKQCGHVYCGECVMNRNVKRGKKGAPQDEGKAEPFSRCVVSGCRKPVSVKTAFFQIYL